VVEGDTLASRHIIKRWLDQLRNDPQQLVEEQCNITLWRRIVRSNVRFLAIDKLLNRALDVSHFLTLSENVEMSRQHITIDSRVDTLIRPLAASPDRNRLVDGEDLDSVICHEPDVLSISIAIIRLIHHLAAFDRPQYLIRNELYYVANNDFMGERSDFVHLLQIPEIRLNNAL
jgi:hypothetical protein